MPKPPTKRALDAAGREYLELLAAQESITERLKELAELFRTAYGLGNYAAGPARVRVQRNVRRDDAAFTTAYPFEEYPDYYRPAIDTATIKRELAPAVLERFQVESAYKVLVDAIPDSSDS